MNLYKRLIIHFIVIDVIGAMFEGIKKGKLMQLEGIPVASIDRAKEWRFVIVLLISMASVAIYKYYNLVKILQEITKLI